MNDFADAISRLVSQGWAVVEDFLPADAIAALAAEAAQLRAVGCFSPAGVGRLADRMVRADIRGDQIYWLDEQALTAAQSRYWTALEKLRQALNRELFLGLTSLEIHYAVYPAGAFYRKHVDRFATAEEREISCTLYLNDNWRAEQGGCLRLYPEQGQVDILPRAGTFVVFRSAALYHEVLPATRERLSLTGWFKRRSLGAIV
jgi:SM-20-related protein